MRRIDARVEQRDRGRAGWRHGTEGLVPADDRQRPLARVGRVRRGGLGGAGGVGLDTQDGRIGHEGGEVGGERRHGHLDGVHPQHRDGIGLDDVHGGEDGGLIRDADAGGEGDDVGDAGDRLGRRARGRLRRGRWRRIGSRRWRRVRRGRRRRIGRRARGRVHRWRRGRVRRTHDRGSQGTEDEQNGLDEGQDGPQQSLPGGGCTEHRWDPLSRAGHRMATPTQRSPASGCARALDEWLRPLAGRRRDECKKEIDASTGRADRGLGIRLWATDWYFRPADARAKVPFRRQHAPRTHPQGRSGPKGDVMRDWVGGHCGQ